MSISTFYLQILLIFYSLFYLLICESGCGLEEVIKMKPLSCYSLP